MTYGALGKHVNAHYKNSLGWIVPARRFEAPPNSSTSILLDHTALVGGANYQMARIPIDVERWYTVEARRRAGHYEAALPGDAVISHHVDGERGEPPWAVDSDVPPADYGDNPGTMWTVGETFTDAVQEISVTVDFATATGFGVTIAVGGVRNIFADGFERGDTSAWRNHQP